MTDRNDVLGAILAGGAGSRMGADKALVKVEGTSMIRRVAQVVAPVAGEVVAVGRPGSLEGLRGIPDPPSGVGGPLAGLVAALGQAAGRFVLLVAVDQPFLRGETCRQLLALARPEQAVVPLDGGTRQVTCALYPPAWAAEAAHEAAAGGSIQSLLDRLPFRAVPEDEWRAWGEDGRSWFSADSPDDIAAGLRRFGPG